MIRFYFCPSCHRQGADEEFLRRHIIERIVEIFVNGDERVYVQRNPSTHDFHCPNSGCYYRECDSVDFGYHVMYHCDARSE